MFRIHWKMQWKLSWWQNQPHCPVSISAQFSAPFVQKFGTIRTEWCRNQAALHVTLFMYNTSNWKSLHAEAISFFAKNVWKRTTVTVVGKGKSKGAINLICRVNIKKVQFLSQWSLHIYLFYDTCKKSELNFLWSLLPLFYQKVSDNEELSWRQ